MDHIEYELAGIASRLEHMEMERAEEKQLARKTAGGILVPKNAAIPAPSTAKLEAEIASMASRIDAILATLAQVARTQRMQQDAIEELSILYAPGQNVG